MLLPQNTQPGGYTDENMLKYVQAVQQRRISYLHAASQVNPDQREQFKYFWEYNQRPETYGQALSEGLGGEAPGANFVRNVSDMIKGMADMMLVEAPRMMGSAISDMAIAMGDTPASAEARIRLELPKRLMTQLTKEIIQGDTPEMQQLRNQLRMEQRRLDKNPAMIARLNYELDRRVQEQSPIMSFLGDEILYFRSHDQLKDKIATAPAEVLSDIMGVLTLPVAGAGAALRGTQASAKLRRVMDVLDMLDPAALPQTVGRGARHMLRPEGRIMKGPDADMTNQRAVEFGERELGVERMEQPDYYQNQQQIFQTREMMRAETEGKVGQRAAERTTGMETAFKEYEQRLIDDINTDDSPIEAENAGAVAIELYKDRQAVDRGEVNQLFSEWNQNYDTPISSEFNIGARLQGMIDRLLGSGEHVSRWQRAAAGVIIEELNSMRRRGRNTTGATAEGIYGMTAEDIMHLPPESLKKLKQDLSQQLKESTINEMSLKSLDSIRTTFRERYNNEFIGQATNKTGGYAAEGRVYNQLTDLLYDAADDTVQRSGAMPTDLSEGLRTAKGRRAEIAQLEDSYGGEFILKHQDNPQGLVKGLIEDKKLTTDELKNAYAVMGEESATVLRASVINTMFEQMADSPKGLENYLKRVTKGRDPAWLAELFGGGDEGQQIADKINDLAEFSALMAPKSRIFSNSPTGKVNMALARSQAGEVMDTAVDIGMLIGYQGAINKTTLGVMILGWLRKGTVGVWDYITKNSEWARKRLLHGHELGDTANAVFDMMVSGQARAGLKGAELTERVADNE